MRILMARIISEIVKDVFFNVYKASTSIPSNAAPALIFNPTPMPRKTPPKMEIESANHNYLEIVEVFHLSDICRGRFKTVL